jgi:hypothetical protein
MIGVIVPGAEVITISGATARSSSVTARRDGSSLKTARSPIPTQ